MYRTLLLQALGLSLTLALVAAVPAEGLEKSADPPKDAPTRTVIALTVDARAESKPALRRALLPELNEMNPGNPIMAYLKCFMEQSYFYHNKAAVADREKWLTMPLDRLPVEKLRGYGGASLRQADYAARLDTPDWQILLKLKTDGINLLLPEVQQLRQLSTALKVRFRGEVAGRRLDEALATARTMLAMARHLGEHPTLIGDLVGLSTAFTALGPLEEMLSQPGCPNLYWPLTDLPTPFIDLRKGMSGERVMLAREFALFAGDEPLEPGQLDRAVRGLDALFSSLHDGKPARESKTAAHLARRAKKEGEVEAARKRLATAGTAADKLRALPALQVLLLDEKLTYETLRDENMKWANAPGPRAEAALARLGKSEALLSPFVSSSYRAVEARVRLDQRFAMLRHVEALRLYAAAHGGKLPASLAEVEVPLPADPVSGKPFDYKVEGKTATLRGSAPRGREKVAAFNVQYEVTIR